MYVVSWDYDEKPTRWHKWLDTNIGFLDIMNEQNFT